MNINDGGGLYDNEGLCDTLINDCNSLVKHIASGQYLNFCASVVEMVQKISNLKKGIHADMGSMINKLEELKRTNDSLMEQITGLPVEKDGAE